MSTLRNSGVLFLVANAGSGNISVHIGLGVVVGRHVVALAALLVKAEPPAFAVLVVIIDLHTHDGAHAGEGVAHQADNGAIAQADDRIRLDGIEQSPGLVRFERGSLAARHHVLGAADGGGRVSWVPPGR